MTAGRWTFLRGADNAPADMPPRPEPLSPLRMTPSAGVEWQVRTGISESERITDLKVWGLRAAGASHGSPQVLKATISYLFYNNVAIDDAFAEEERRRVDDLSAVIAEKSAELQRARHRKEEVDLSLKVERDALALRKSELAAVRAGDTDVVESQGLSEKMSFFIAGGILLFLTLYLFLFYVSAIYNAFIFDAAKAAQEGLQTGRELSVTIFNGLAFQKAWASGFFTFAFIGSAPSIVLGLGFLIHHFSQLGKRLRIAAIILVTFLFDLLLAYEIVYQIYRIKVLTGEATESWSLGHLFNSAEFYIILLAGFVVYVIWGLILQVVLEGVEKFRPARVAARKLAHAVKASEDAISQQEGELRQAGREVVGLEAELLTLEQKRSPRELRNNAFRRHIQELMSGWLTYVAQAFPEERLQRQAEAQKIQEETVAGLTAA